MNNTVNPEKLRKAKIASCCFMGLGQILFLKQYIRGALYALVEIAMICAIVIGTKNIIPGNRKEASYFENTRPEYSEMVKYFSSDDAKDYKSDSDAILEKGASAFKKSPVQVIIKLFGKWEFANFSTFTCSNSAGVPLFSNKS